ncbi:hypothetical protein VDGE_30693 [Verticillium dahliae]|uniref:Uncharacterized protein n=1 Tax=Verticillium dahliae TaxID=27337 RepID=A0A444RKK7_VERDA|nr:hypothetical protein VDGE_30693 [Verticillium dahliae]
MPPPRPLSHHTPTFIPSHVCSAWFETSPQGLLPTPPGLHLRGTSALVHLCTWPAAAPTIFSLDPRTADFVQAVPPTTPALACKTVETSLREACNRRRDNHIHQELH